MALLTLNVYSHVLGMDIPLNVLLPERRKRSIIDTSKKKYPVLYLLHGHSDDYSAWIRKSSIELIVRNLEIIVVMPYIHRGFYTDCQHGPRYFTFISEELPQIICNMFHASSKREDTFVAGNSMGGYGAFKLAITCPNRFSKAASLSGVLMPLPQLLDEKNNEIFNIPDFTENIKNIFGNMNQYQQSINDLCFQIKKLSTYTGKQPLLYQCCGQEDLLVYKQNTIFHNFVNTNIRNLNYIYNESTGNHDWEYWMPRMKEFIEMLELNPIE